jgi:hypothetical protein
MKSQIRIPTGQIQLPVGSKKRSAPAASSFTPAWQTLRLGAGGQITDIHIDPSDNTTLIRTDTYGGYLYVPSGSCSGWGTTYSGPCWQQLVTSNSIPSPDFTTMISPLNYAVAEIVACHSKTNVGYMIWNSKLYVTTNLKNSGGPTWVATTLTGLQSGGSQTLKNFGPFIACDPNNPNVAYISKPSTGTIVTTNGTSGGSATFTTVGTVGSAANGSVIAFDPSSTFSGGFTQRFMICTHGTGCYLTSDGGTAAGGSFTLTTSTPTTYKHLIGDKFGQFWLTDGSTNVRRYLSSWATQALGGKGDAVATDPASSSSAINHVVVAENGGQLIISSNNGGTWTGASPQNPGNAASTGSQPGWLNTANQSSGGVQFLNTLGIAFDTSSNIWNAAGIGVYTTSAPVTQTQTPWAANVIGIEEFVANQVVVPPGNSPLVSIWDRGFTLVKNPDAFPSVYWNNSTSLNPIMGGWSLDYASAGGSTNFVTGWEISNTTGVTSPASSSDGGNTWTQWPTNPSSVNVGGNVAASTATNWVAIAGCNSANCGFISGKPVLSYTTNGAASWSTSSIAGNPNFVSQVGVRFPLAADRVTAGSFCAVDLSLNFYNSTNNGANFTLVATSSAVDGGGGNGADTLVSVPGRTGHYFYTSGSASGAHPVNNHLWKSTNSCAAWTNVNANLKEVMAVGFGAPLPGGGGYPSIYVYGWLSGVLGFYQSNDGGTTWAAINVPASQQVWYGNTLDFLNQLTGDPNVYGRFYAASRASGTKYIETADACPWVNFSDINPKDNVSGTITLTATHSGLVPVTDVQFSVDGTNIGSAQTGAGPYSVSWNTGGVANGAHTLKVQAAGNGCTTTSNSFSIPVTTH